MRYQTVFADARYGNEFNHVMQKALKDIEKNDEHIANSTLAVSGSSVVCILEVMEGKGPADLDLSGADWQKGYDDGYSKGVADANEVHTKAHEIQENQKALGEDKIVKTTKKATKKVTKKA